MNRRRVLCSLLLVLTSAAQVLAWGRGWTKVPTIVLVAPEQDPRLQVARAAVDFWNRMFADIGTPFRLGAVTHSTDAIAADYLDRLSAHALYRATKPDVPESVTKIPGDIIVVLSDGAFISFAAALPSAGKVLVGIKSARLYPLTLPNVARNVIAHELGHALGLGHNDDPTTLMCGRPAPCRPEAFTANAEWFFPLTEAEKALLLQMYPRNWSSHP